MDSGNSGSMQSSSGGDEEYDSRAESISAFLNSSGQLCSMSNSRPPPPPVSHPQSSHAFDPLSNYMDAFPRSPQPSTVNSLLNLDMVWARGLRSDPNCTDIGGLIGSSSASAPTAATRDVPSTARGTYHGGGISPSIQLPVSDRPPPSADQPQVARNSKKRSRASRRAPTTVLTTDTSNFRAMVQEFTGIPAPPFSASPFPRTRFDLFGSASAMRSGLTDASPPPYLLRPFAQKIQSSSFPSLQLTSASTSSLASSSPAAAMLDVLSSNTTSTLVSTSANSNTAAATTNSSSTNNFQHQNLLNVNNPLFTFQSLLQTPAPPKYPPLSNLPVFNSKQQGPSTIPSADPSLKMGMLEDFAVNHGNASTHLSSLSGLMASDGLPTRTEHPPNWADGAGHGDGDQAQLRNFNSNYDASQRVGNCKLNYASSSTDFHAEKGPDNVTSRGEGPRGIMITKNLVFSSCPANAFCSFLSCMILSCMIFTEQEESLNLEQKTRTEPKEAFLVSSVGLFRP
ncbi:chitinase-like protein PB1E7.04c [Aristolochia californica]|uniref:chitinase-like protein PB1E7.04c n=1 Tax=Aristolochia californica TaxID=171875 RepID=UPI0035D58F07